MRSRLWIAWVVALGCCGPIMAQSGLDSEAIVRQNEAAVVVITGKRIDTGASVQGSGCCIHPEGYVIATAHQVNGVDHFAGKLNNGKSVGLRLIEMNAPGEWALLKADSPLPAVTLGDAQRLHSGAPLLAIAAPKNLEFTTVVGIVSNTSRTWRGFPVIQTNLPADHGSSGGPVFDRHGALIGLIILSLGEADWVSAVNPINNVFPLLKKHRLLAAPSAAAPQAAEEYELIPAQGITTKELRAIEAYNDGVYSTTPAEKRDAYQLAVTLLPDFFEAWFNLGVAESTLGNASQAIAAYQRALALRAKNLPALRNLGRVYMHTQAYKQASEVFGQAAQLAPEAPQSHNDLGEALRQQGDPKAAQAAFEQALQRDPAYAPAHFNLGLCLNKTGRYAEAIKHFERYLAAAPKAPDAGQVRDWISALQQQIKE